MTFAHALVARACLGILLHLAKGINTMDSLGYFPSVKYAAKHWVNLVRFEYLSRKMVDGMKQLFDSSSPHLAICYWLEKTRQPDTNNIQLQIAFSL